MSIKSQRLSESVSMGVDCENSGFVPHSDSCSSDHPSLSSSKSIWSLNPSLSESGIHSNINTDS